MPKTSTEELIQQIKRSSRSESILVPRIEDFLRRPVEIDDDADRWYLQTLIEARSQKRKKGVYSPSMLATCVRQVYLTQKKTKKKKVERTAMSGYFLDGNFRHFKWQFLMWKMHRAGKIVLIDAGSICLGAEVPVMNERGDFGGTIDNLIYIPEIEFVCTVDWKGMNSSGFNRALYQGPSLQYIVQSVGYSKLANASLDLPKKIENVLIIGEHKNGPMMTRKVKAPLGLVEWKFSIKENQHHVDSRMKSLRGYARREEMPPPECKSIRIQAFKDCPFSPICRGEIEASERKQLSTKKITKKPSVQFNSRKK